MSVVRKKKKEGPASLSREQKGEDHTGGGPLCALVRNYSRACTGNPSWYCRQSLSTLHSTDSTPKSCDLIQVSNSNRFQRIHHAIYRTCRSIGHDFAAPKVGRSLPPAPSIIYILNFRFTMYMHIISHLSTSSSNLY